MCKIDKKTTDIIYNHPLLAYKIITIVNGIYYKDKHIQEECAICLDKINDNISLLKCSHIFHGKCLDKWYNKTCPICRKEITTTWKF